MQEVLQLNQQEMALIASLRQERGLYSEAFLMAGDNRSVVAVESTPLEYWIATTDPREVSKIEEFAKSQNIEDRIQVLTELSKKYPQGILTKESV